MSTLLDRLISSAYDQGLKAGKTPGAAYAPDTGWGPELRLAYGRGFDDGVDSLPSNQTKPS